MSESPCRLTVSLKRPAEPASSSPLRVSGNVACGGVPSLIPIITSRGASRPQELVHRLNIWWAVAVSDTGVGSKLEEFLELDALARETPVEKWGMINVMP